MVAMDFPAGAVNGQVYKNWVFNSTTGKWDKRGGAGAGYLLGAIYPWPGNTVPDWGVELDGSTIVNGVTLYPGLAALFPGWVAGSNLVLPDWRGRSPMGYKSGDAMFGAMGALIGEKDHLLTIAEMPAHNHILRVKNAGAATYGELGGGDASGTGANQSAAGAPMYNTGGGLVHNNVGPAVVAKWIVCAVSSMGVADPTVQNALAVAISTGYRLLQTLYFTSSGTFSKGSYPLAKAVRVRLVGAGGGGSGSAATSTAPQISFGNGGGGGGYAEALIPVSSLATSETVTVGAGGTSTGAAPGTAGGTSSFGSLVSASGGGGGLRKIADQYGSYVGTAAGGAGTLGDLLLTGSPGGMGDNAGSGIGSSGSGGDSVLGGGGWSKGSGGSGSSQAGAPGGNYGGGGAGALSTSSSAQNNGGAGAPGIVIVELYA